MFDSPPVTHMPLRLLEIILAAYIGGIGIMFNVYPAALADAVYAAFIAERTPAQWGWMMIATALLHLGATVYNGRNRWVSLPLRLLAIGCHTYLVAQFIALFLASGAPWGAGTYLFVLALLCVVAFYAIKDLTLLFRGGLNARSHR
jgi:hypothetical protein